MAIVLEPMPFRRFADRGKTTSSHRADTARIYHLDGLSASRASARGGWPLITRE